MIPRSEPAADLSERELPAAAATSSVWTAPGRRVRAWQAKRNEALRVRRIREVLPFFRSEIHAWRSAGSISPDDRIRLEHRLRYALRVECQRQFVARRLGLLFGIAIALSFIGYFAALPLAVPRQYWAG